MQIQNNISAINSHRQSGINTTKQAKSTEKLSSGFRVNRAADDAAGLAISEKMRTQIRGLNRASLNIQDGVSLIQVADGVMQSMTDMSQRMRELAVQAANDTNQDIDRNAIQLEIDQLTSEINTAVKSAEFNGRLLFDGSVGSPYEWHLGLKTHAMGHSPAIITAGQTFLPDHVSAWNMPTNFGTTGSTNLNTLQNGLPPGTGPNFPREGIFAINVQTPAHGNLNIVLDFAVANPTGSFAQADFVDFIEAGFEDFRVRLGLEDPIIEGVSIGANGQISIRFPRGDVPSQPTGIMGMSGTQPRVHIGIGASNTLGGATQTAQLATINSGMMFTNRNTAANPINSSTLFANSALFGGSASGSASNQGIMLPAIGTLTAGEIAHLESLMTANVATLSTDTELWRLLSGASTFTFEAVNTTPTPSVTIDSLTFVKSALPGTVTNIAEFNTFLGAAASANPHFNSMSVSPTLHRDRDGNFYVSFTGSGAASAASQANSVRFGYNSEIFCSTVNNASSTTLPSATSTYEAKISEEIGLLSISINNRITGAGIADARVDFSSGSKPVSLINHADLFDITTLVGQINTQLNANPGAYANPAVPPPQYNSDFPIAMANIDSNGRLIITSSERLFTISVEEQFSDKPMLTSTTSAQTAATAPTTMTVTVSGAPHNITLVSGDYNDGPGGVPRGIDRFITANRTNFASQGFLLSEESGRLVITTIQGGENLTLASPAVSTNPATLLAMLGFNNENTYVNGESFETTETEALWIQSGANVGDGKFIEIPRLCARSLGLAMWRLVDDGPPWMGYSPMGAAGYRNIASVQPLFPLEPPGFSLDVTTHETASNAISTIHNAIIIISMERSQLGARMNRLEYTMSNVDNTAENLAASESRIRDVDMAREMAVFTRNNILTQTATSMLSQANTLPQGVLRLLQ